MRSHLNHELVKFVDRIEQLVQEYKNENEITKKIAEQMEKLLEKDDVIPKEYMQPNPEKYTLYPLYIAPDNSFSIASAVWDVGQSTPIHDHGTWGVIGIVQGIESEVHYEFPTPGSKPEVKVERKLHQGEVAVCCTSDQDVHEVSCISNKPCIGIHVYGGNIGEIERHVYDSETGHVQTVITAWDPVPTL